MYYKVNRIWNGRTSGIPMALILGVLICLRSFQHRLVTLLWRGNLGAFGKGAKIQAGVKIRNPSKVKVGDGSQIASGVEITSELSDGFCHIGSGVIIGQGVRLDCSGGLIIKDNVVISEKTTVFTHSHGLCPKSVPSGTELIIEEDVWVGSNVIIVEGVTSIGQSSIVAAGAVVTHPIPDHVIVAGVPARILRMK